MPDIGGLAFEDRLSLLLEREKTERGRRSYLLLKDLGISTRYFRVSRLLDELTFARRDGSCPKLVQRLAKTWLLVLDDWGLKGGSMRRLYDSTKQTQPHLIHPYPAFLPDHRSTPDGLVRNAWTTSSHVGHRRMEPQGDSVGFSHELWGVLPLFRSPCGCDYPIHAVGGIAHQPVSKSAGVRNTEAQHATAHDGLPKP